VPAAAAYIRYPAAAGCLPLIFIIFIYLVLIYYLVSAAAACARHSAAACCVKNKYFRRPISSVECFASTV
jgi:hypothetical protein